MMACAALRSLKQILDEVLYPAGGRRIYHNRAQLRSLYKKVRFLLDFLEKSSSDYRKRNDIELERVESKIRDAANKAKYVIESDISNQLLGVPRGANLIDLLFVIVFTVELFPAAFHIVLAPCILAFIPVMHAFLIFVQFFLPVSFHDALFIMARILSPVMVYNLEPFFVSSVIAYWVGYLMDTEALKAISFVRYWLYVSQPENQDLHGAVDEFSVIMTEVIKIKDAHDSGQNSDSQHAGSAVSLSIWDFGGIGSNVVVGLDYELREIYDRLSGDQPQPQIVSILGMGGIGKTTLARQVYEAPHIVYYFDLCAWITVSQKYSLRDVMLGILNSAKICTEEIFQNHNENEDVLVQKLGEHLHKKLKDRRYLIVMDDVWDKKVWDFVRIFFPENSNGSRVLLTTRLSEVATYANSGRASIHKQFLNGDDSWNLLYKKVFRGEGCPPELEVIGRTIARNCKGLPLAIVVVGGLLYNEHNTVQDWDYVSNNLKLILNEDDTQCPDILGLSYNHLPHHLKPCFLYMGSFCEDEEIHVGRLFNLWAAEGFLEATKAKSLEEVAEEYLKDLIQRSLVMVGKWSCNGKIKTCKIHDLIRDFCWLNAWKENFLYFPNWRLDDNEGGIWHRVSTLFDSVNASAESRSFYVMARSLIFAGRTLDDLTHIYYDFRLLRVLDVVASNLHEFPDAIFKLVHLRYLGVTYNYRLPPAISQLWNLQTIVYYGRRFGSSLKTPVEIWSLPNLRHLYFRGDFLPDPPSFWFQLPRNSPLLVNLQTLVGISNFRCTEGIVKSIPHLKELRISYDEVSPAECQLESLVNLHQLQILEITIQNVLSLSSVLHPAKLGFPHKLKELSLCGCRLPWESMSAVGALPDLQVLKLRNYAYQGRIWEPVEGQFCQLMFLLVEDTDLEEWRANESHFPCMQHLILSRCHQLKEIPYGIGEILTLKRMELFYCHPRAVASAKFIQEEQESMGNELLKIHIQEP